MIYMNNRWKVEQWAHCLRIGHCSGMITYDMNFHDLDKMLTCHCGAKFPEEHMTKLLKLTKVLIKYDLHKEPIKR